MRFVELLQSRGDACQQRTLMLKENLKAGQIASFSNINTSTGRLLERCAITVPVVCGVHRRPGPSEREVVALKCLLDARPIRGGGKLNDFGNSAERDDTLTFAKQHGLPGHKVAVVKLWAQTS
jgi:hypothetical protein